MFAKFKGRFNLYFFKRKYKSHLKNNSILKYLQLITYQAAGNILLQTINYSTFGLSVITSGV